MKGSKKRAHFDIGLADAIPKCDDAGVRNVLLPHKVRQTAFHPKPSTGYLPMMGAVPEMMFRQGLSVACIDKSMPEGKRYSFKSSNSPLLFAYCLEGSRHLRLKGLGIEDETRAGRWYVGYIPDCTGEGMIMGSPRFRGVTLRFDPLVLYDLLEGHVEGLPSKLHTLLKRLESDVITLGGQMSQPLVRAVSHLALCNRESSFSKLVFESRMIDVLMLHLQEIGGWKSGACDTRLTGQEKKVAEQARAIVLDNLENPPSLNLLAEQVKVAPFAMKSIFSTAFGTSVHSFVHSRRLELAKMLLDSGDRQVAEVAQAVGYNNISWFIDVFFRQYGIKPGEYLRQAKKLHCVSTCWASAS